MNILIVDDDTAITESICNLVNWKKLGIDRIRTAQGGAAARNLIREEEADIVISDIEMPGESGLDFLRWFREEKYTGKFLLLTCHESFAYAQEALKLHADEYLLKPFRVDMIEMVLQKMGASLREEKGSTADPGEGPYARRRTLGVLSDLLTGRIKGDISEIKTEMPFSVSLLAPEKKYCLMVVRATNLEKDIELYGRNLILFTLENVISELLTGSPENTRVVYFDHGKYWSFAVFCDAAGETESGGKTEATSAAGDLKAAANELLSKIGSMFSLTLTCCLCPAVPLSGCGRCFAECQELLDKDVIHYGTVFAMEEGYKTADEGRRALDLRVMEEYLDNKNKKAFLDYVKKELNTAVKLNVMDHEQMACVIREIQQAIYAHLAARGISINLIVENEDAAGMSRKAEQSVIDLIRWVNYLLSHVFEYEEELQKSSGIITEIESFIQKHYKEDIGRNEIGAAFFLVPEYVAKLYKKKTGVTLKDAINEYRLAEAKALLLTTDRKVSDIASDVGFDNFSYFSTLFKKNLGMTPNEFRKQ